MKFIVKGPARTLLLCALVFLCFSCGSQKSGVGNHAVTGDYLFDGMSFDAMFNTAVYEEDGKLFALSDIMDYPVEMKRVKADPPTFRIKFKTTGDFNFVFSDLKKDRYRTLSWTSNDSEFQIEGYRNETDMSKLRDYNGSSAESYSYKVPLQLDDGLDTGSIIETGIDTTALNAMINDILENYNYMHSLLIMKDGKLVVEEYFNGWDPVRLHRLQSVTKSFVSTLVGQALENGYIDSVGDPIYKYMPEYDSLLTGEKREITIEHLLTMSAGFEWNELATYYAAPESCDAHLAGDSGDFIKYVLEKPLVYTPGQHYDYNSGFPNMLGHIIAEKSGMNIMEFSMKYLFEPLGTERAYWWARSRGKKYRPGCAGGLRLTSRDMLKYGYLYLRDGVWNKKRILNKEWVRKSVEGRMDSGYDTRYGYLWKSIRSLDGKYGMFFASGTGGQFIICVPGLDAVVVTTAVYKTDKGNDVAMLLLRQLVPALAGS